jgi:hypothetical protein
MTDLIELANACQALAEKLDKEQAAENYEGQQAITLGKLATNLSALASTLRTAIVSETIANNEDAMAKLGQATQDAIDATDNLKTASTAIKIAGHLLTLGAAVISENPGAIISAAVSIASDVQALTA